MSRLYAAAIGLALIVGGLGAMAGLRSCTENAGNYAEQQAHAHVGAANVHQEQGGKAEAKVAELEAIAARQAADLGRLSAERDALLRKLASKPRPGADPVGDNPSPSDPVGHDCVALAERLEAAEAVVAKDAEVIEAQAQQIATGKESLQVAMTRGDEYKAAFESERKARQAQEVATKAWKSAVTTSKWRGRIEGFAAGAALGYLGGRR